MCLSIHRIVCYHELLLPVLEDNDREIMRSCKVIVMRKCDSVLSVPALWFSRTKFYLEVSCLLVIHAHQNPLMITADQKYTFQYRLVVLGRIQHIPDIGGIQARRVSATVRCS